MPEVAQAHDGEFITVTVPMRFRRRGGRRVVIQPEQVTPAVENPPDGDDTLPRTLARAFRWKRMFEEGRFGTMARLAAAEGVTKAYISRSLKLTLMAPSLIDAILDGSYDHRCFSRAMRSTLPELWHQQIEHFARIRAVRQPRARMPELIG
jgi:hypothetical protein